MILKREGTDLVKRPHTTLLLQDSNQLMHAWQTDDNGLAHFRCQVPHGQLWREHISSSLSIHTTTHFTLRRHFFRFLNCVISFYAGLIIHRSFQSQSAQTLNVKWNIAHVHTGFLLLVSSSQAGTQLRIVSTRLHGTSFLLPPRK